ncbi:MAG: LemA family protein [Nanoarchaeota archaeon]|nr:LemA family protein [Nanoarchaeota archaeon]
MDVLIPVLGIIVIGGFVIYYFNRIIVLENRIKNAWSQIDVQLKKRADLVPNLVETVKGYMKHERSVFENIAKARKEMLKATTQEQKIKAGNMLADALKTIFAIAENYPKLRASENFLMLQEELSGIENKIAYARQFYNDSVLEYNNLIKTIPGVWFAKLMGKKEKQYIEIKEVERKPVKVKF